MAKVVIESKPSADGKSCDVVLSGDEFGFLAEVLGNEMLRNVQLPPGGGLVYPAVIPGTVPRKVNVKIAPGG